MISINTGCELAYLLANANDLGAAILRPVKRRVLHNLKLHTLNAYYMALAQEHGVEMPIARDVHRVVVGGGTAKQAFRGLLRVLPGAESEPG